jgi:hypothetical protein
MNEERNKNSDRGESAMEIPKPLVDRDGDSRCARESVVPGLDVGMFRKGIDGLVDDRLHRCGRLSEPPQAKLLFEYELQLLNLATTNRQLLALRTELSVPGRDGIGAGWKIP